MVGDACCGGAATYMGVAVDADPDAALPPVMHVWICVLPHVCVCTCGCRAASAGSVVVTVLLPFCCCWHCMFAS